MSKALHALVLESRQRALLPGLTWTTLGVATALFGTSVSGQAQSGKVFARVNKPLKSASLDLATGTITRGPAVHNRTASTIVDFYNLDLGGFAGVDTGSGFCEWFDAGIKGSLVGDGTAVVDRGNLSDLMNSIVFSYCSAVLTPGSGGPGGSVRLGFYEGYVTGGGTATTSVAALTLTGLPGNSASSSFFGGFDCFFLRVTFGNLIAFADGPIGYSWKFLDNGTGTINPQGAVLAGTFPFLSCVVSCSGAVDQVDGQGMEDRIDEYCPPGTLRSSFTFGTTSGSFTSLNMAIEEATDVGGTVLATNSSTFPNPDVLVSTPAVLGETFSASLALGRARLKSGSWVMYFGTAQLNPPAGIAIGQFTAGLNFGTAKSGRMLLCGINVSGLACIGTHAGVLGSTSHTNCGGGRIPTSIGLVCNPWCAQAVVLGAVAGCDSGGNARLSSAVSGIIGTTDNPALRPAAAFVATPVSGVAPLTVEFTNESTGPITSHAWMFGDGTTSSATSPRHTYTEPGTYTVTLTESGPGGSSVRMLPGHIAVSASAPVADFVGTPLSGNAPLTVNFTNLSTGEIACHSWTFGDGGTSTEASPSHTYTAPGTYTVALTETGSGGSGTLTRPAYITVDPPVAQFVGNPRSGFVNSMANPPVTLTVNFTNQSTGSITSHAWTFGDGGTSTEASPSHTYTAPGTYTVALTETGPGGSNTRTRQEYVTALTQLALPDDAADCFSIGGVSDPLTLEEFQGWFAEGAAGLVEKGGLVKPADSLHFDDTPNCNFFKWSEQMFLWLTSPATPQYGGGGGLVMTTQAFYDVSVRDVNGRRHFIPHTPGTTFPVGLATSQTGALGLPLVFEDGTQRALEVIPPVLSASGKQLVLDAAGAEVEVGSIRFTLDNPPVLLDLEGKAIRSPRAMLRSRREGKVRDFELKLQRLESVGSFDRSRLVQRFVEGGQTVLLGLGGNLSTSVGQAYDESVLMAQNGSLVYYSIIANNVFVLYRSVVDDNGEVPAGTQFPVRAQTVNDPPFGDRLGLDAIRARALQEGMTSILDEEALAMEIKASWVEAKDLPGANQFIQMTAVIPNFDPNDQWLLKGTRVARLALVGLHIVGSTAGSFGGSDNGHPEMLWATFEHLNNAPAARYLYVDSNSIVQEVERNTTGNWMFCSSGADVPFNVSLMRFTGDRIEPWDTQVPIGPTNVLRRRPWGSHTDTPDAAEVNAQVISLNNSVREFLHPEDVRRNYFHVGTVWTREGETPDVVSNLRGTVDLANSTIETFAQQNNASNCFSCHTTNTTAVSQVFNETEPFF